MGQGSAGGDVDQTGAPGVAETAAQTGQPADVLTHEAAGAIERDPGWCAIWCDANRGLAVKSPDAGTREIRFDAEHPVSGLPIVTDLTAKQRPIIIQVKRHRRKQEARRGSAS